MRSTKDAWAMAMARITADRSTCLRRRVGAVLLNARGHVLATGYNGVATGMNHCNEPTGIVEVMNPVGFVSGKLVHGHACLGANADSGTNLDACQAIHAEQNALLQCHEVYTIDTCYCTTAPCMTCTKLLLNTSCRRIVFLENYPHAASARDLWVGAAGRLWEQFQEP
jgi:dCMP deaminase